MRVSPLLLAESVQLIASSGHPNEMKLTGTLVRLDEPSTKAPHGSDGHRIQVSTKLAKSKLGTLINMGLNYAPDMKQHAQRRKVGVITKAWIDGRDLKVEATVWKRDFPEAERDLKRAGLGMSMEIGDVSVADPDAKIWELSDFCFLGATVLERTAAAYFHTHAIAAARAKELTMAVKTKKKPGGIGTLIGKEVAEIAAKAARDAVAEVLGPIVASQGQILARFDAMDASAGDEDEEDVEASADEPDMTTGKKKVAAKKGDDDDDDDDDEDDEDMESAVDTGDEEELGPEESVGDDAPGKLNREVKNLGRKGSSDDKVGKSVAATRLKASLAREATTRNLLAKATRELKSTKSQMADLKRQVTAAGEQTARRSVQMPHEIRTLLTKSGVDINDLNASGEKLTVEQVDAMLDNMGNLPAVKRIEMKTFLAHSGHMEEGRVDR